ncbi:MAG TPA: DUF2336 domain-containing protein [Microvirga sp.]|jgi:hypothetical protein
MNPVRHLLMDLEGSLSNGSPERRAHTLRDVTDLFLADVDRLTDEQVAIFDQVIGRLAQAIEVQARAELSRRLAPVEKAPPGVIRSLAHDEIEVAHPVLVQSARLDEGDLIAVAVAKSGEHRHAIAQRQHVPEPVSDVLVARGDGPVIRALAANAGARLSRNAAAVLVDRARLDDELRLLLKDRADLPPGHIRRLLDIAEETARRRLATSTPSGLHAVMEQALARSAKRVRAVAGSLDYTDAIDTIGAIQIGRTLDEDDVVGFAQADYLEETICAVAACAGLSLQAAERLFTLVDSDLILIVSKAQGWSWSTVRTLLKLRDPEAGLPHNLKRHAETYAGLADKTAQRVLRMMRRRDREERDAAAA